MRYPGARAPQQITFRVGRFRHRPPGRQLEILSQDPIPAGGVRCGKEPEQIWVKDDAADCEQGLAAFVAVVDRIPVCGRNGAALPSQTPYRPSLPGAELLWFSVTGLIGIVVRRLAGLSVAMKRG